MAGCQKSEKWEKEDEGNQGLAIVDLGLTGAF